MRRVEFFVLAAIMACFPLSASSIGVESVTSSPGSSYYSLESFVTLRGGSLDSPAGGWILFSGYLNSWYEPSGEPFYDFFPSASFLSTPDQILLIDYAHPLPGSSAGYGEGQISAVARSFWATAPFEQPGSAQIAAAAQIRGTMQVFQVHPAESVPSNVPEPGPATLVFLGCCVVASSLALANRSSKALEAEEETRSGNWRDV